MKGARAQIEALNKTIAEQAAKLAAQNSTLGNQQTSGTQLTAQQIKIDQQATAMGTQATAMSQANTKIAEQTSAIAAAKTASDQQAATLTSQQTTMSQMNATLAAATATNDAQGTAIAQLIAGLAALTARVVALEATWLGVPTTIPKLTTALGAGQTADVTITWQKPAPSVDAYQVYPTISLSTLSLLGSVAITLKPGTRTKTGCVLQVKNNALVSLALGSEVNVLGFQ